MDTAAAFEYLKLIDFQIIPEVMNYVAKSPQYFDLYFEGSSKVVDRSRGGAP